MDSKKTQETPPINLGLVRTDLANERTLLAYGRTALMVVGTGVSMIKFLAESQAVLVLGWLIAGIGILVAILGVLRFMRLNRRLHS